MVHFNFAAPCLVLGTNQENLSYSLVKIENHVLLGILVMFK